MHRSEFSPEKPRDFRDLVGEAFLSGFLASGELTVRLIRNPAVSTALIDSPTKNGFACHDFKT